MKSKKQKYGCIRTIAIIMMLLLQASITAFATQPKAVWTTKVDANDCNLLKSTSDGGVVVVGSKESGDLYAVLKYNAQGVNEWNTMPETQRSLFLSSVSEVKGEGFSISGFIGVNNVRFALVTYGYAAIVNYTGDVSWKREIKEDDPGDLFLRQYDNPYTRTKDGDYAVLNNIAIQSDSKNNFKLLFHFHNKNGTVNEVVVDTIRDCEELRVHTFQQTADGGFFGFFYPTTDNRPREYYLIKLDKNGAVQWKKTWQENDYTLRGGTAIELSNGGFAVVNNTIGPTGNAQLRKFSADGELIYHKEIIAKRLTKINSIAETKNHGIVLAGSTLDFDGVATKWPSDIQDFYLGQVNSMGELVEQSVWGVENRSDVISQVAVAEDGNFIIGGTIGEVGSAFVSKVIPNVSSVFEGKSETNIFNLHLIGEGTKFSVDYTLPQNAVVSMSIFDILGTEIVSVFQNVEKQTGTYSIPLPTSQLLAGTYFLRCTDGKNLTTKTLTIIK